MLSTNVKSSDREIPTADRQALLDVAQLSIQSGLRSGQPAIVKPAEFSDALREPRASFVTLHIGTELRGCIGSVGARRPLVVDVAENAFNAAFRDARFPPLSPEEYGSLTVNVSVLSPVEPIAFAHEANLLEQVRAGVDGLEIEYGPHHGLLLPSVWEHLPNKRQFLRTLKMKAGLPPTFWARQMSVNRFTTESFGREPSGTGELKVGESP